MGGGQLIRLVLYCWPQSVRMLALNNRVVGSAGPSALDADEMSEYAADSKHKVLLCNNMHSLFAQKHALHRCEAPVVRRRDGFIHLENIANCVFLCSK